MNFKITITFYTSGFFIIRKDKTRKSRIHHGRLTGGLPSPVSGVKPFRNGFGPVLEPFCFLKRFLDRWKIGLNDRGYPRQLLATNSSALREKISFRSAERRGGLSQALCYLRKTARKLLEIFQESLKAKSITEAFPKLS